MANWRVWTRKTPRWGAILVALPFLLVILTGLMLQLKKDWTWVQPPTKRGTGDVPQVSFDTILAAAKSVPEAGVESWADVDRLDVRPDRGLVKVQAKSGWEVQVDTGTGQVLQTAYRRSDLIETLHDGSWFGDRAKLWVFLPVVVIVLGLWVTGVYLFFLPLAVRWSRARERRRSARLQSGQAPNA
ncbi:MAG TPA: PepSY domain-containing protein [Gemmataceae bacterium]|nr:PepSY domain-containing protein [Gemmataceae bacterium]